MASCDFPKAKAIAEANEWHLLIYRRSIWRHRNKIHAYMRERKRGRKAMKQ